MEFLGVPWEVLLQNGGWGVVLVFVLLIAFGKLVPRRTMQDLLDVQKQRAEYFREAFEKSDARNDEIARQVTAMYPLIETTNRLLQGLYDRSKQENR